MIEIERKFLVQKDGWPKGQERVVMRQGYMAKEGNVVCRVRQKNSQYYISVKARIDDLSSYDYEYTIPEEDGETMLAKLCEKSPVDKTRHLVEHDGLTWEVDEFHGANTGLVVAEVELPSADFAFDAPEWIGDEVSGDKRYTNYALYCNPYGSW